MVSKKSTTISEDSKLADEISKLADVISRHVTESDGPVIKIPGLLMRRMDSPT